MIIRPRLNDFHNLPFKQDGVDFAIPFETALVIPDSDPCKIASAIEMMANNKELRKNMKSKIISMARSFCWENYCTEMERVFHEEIGEKK